MSNKPPILVDADIVSRSTALSTAHPDRISDEHGCLWYACCGIKWSPTTWKIPGPGYGASCSGAHGCGKCGTPFPADFLARAFKADTERTPKAKGTGR